MLTITFFATFIKVNIKNNGFNLILNSQDGGTYTGLGWTSINGISYVAIR